MKPISKNQKASKEKPWFVYFYSNAACLLSYLSNLFANTQHGIVVIWPTDDEYNFIPKHIPRGDRKKPLWYQSAEAAFQALKTTDVESANKLLMFNPLASFEDLRKNKVNTIIHLLICTQAVLFFIFITNNKLNR